MISVADVLRQEARDEVARLAPEERVELAFRLGDDDLEAYRLGQGVDRAEAVRRLQARRQRGRRHSGCIKALLRR